MSNFNLPLSLARFLNAEGEDWRDAFSNLTERSETDYWQGSRFRVIHEDSLLDILTDELEDEYLLGCFNAEFIARVMDWPIELVEAAQKGEAHEAIGQAIINANKTRDLAEAYARADGFGHHFASYDGKETTFADWYVFRTN